MRAIKIEGGLCFARNNDDDDDDAVVPLFSSGRNAIVFLGGRGWDRFFVDEDTSETRMIAASARASCAHGAKHGGGGRWCGEPRRREYYGVEGKSPGRGGGVMLCQRALLERTSSGPVTSRTEQTLVTRRWRLRRVLVAVGGPRRNDD